MSKNSLAIFQGMSNLALTLIVIVIIAIITLLLIRNRHAKKTFRPPKTKA